MAWFRNKLLLAVVLGMTALASPFVAVVFYEQGQNGAGNAVVWIGALAAITVIVNFLFPGEPST